MCAQQAVPAVFSVNPLFLMMLLRGGTGTEFDFQENHEKSEPKLSITPLKNEAEKKNMLFQKSENTKMPLNLRVNLENHDVF